MSDVVLRVIDADGRDSNRTVSVDRVANCGYTGRNQDEVQKHVEELEAEGIPAPETVPSLYPKPSHLLTTEDTIEVYSDRTSGEAEFVLYPRGSETLVGVGSDHTDRELEREDIPRAKLVCQNVASDDAWRLDDVADHWDELVLRSWTGPEMELYQEATLDALLPPEDLFEFVTERSTEPLEGTAVFSGSVGTVSGELVCGDAFRVELHDPVLDRSLDHEYDVRELDWVR